ncbi:adenylate/guanylate cyclase domain-containing protein [Leptospira kanakyensis]|uniref:Guanylate cyclase n=1 Tax=Leptospira kanakyensis TaxID=2484968 RepID=A0A6N4Q9E2_9LEPT|nr:adenylate/guanylate cyclase domain-containing protein [Leptospira kanakyensis]MCW7468043.1 2Fe-2S iron-sulfur cluster-binding protein [Leptospira kanakyensis]TGK49317.1 guanylate cyclase [Leptospira kanakyensis]TGK60442.1 guanylate cyclase [Leptospira kanakyensis]TGK67840.1 guanylate cyclase [Leptospira kanakyensis]
MSIVTFEDKENFPLETNKPGATILETALKHDYPLYHLCGGNAKCTTCRVFVTDGLQYLSTRNDREQTLADRKGWPTEIRLACQTEVFGDISLRRIIKDNKDLKTVTSESKSSKTGEECYAVILFLDIKGFTAFTEASLPYDVVFVLNRFFQEMSEPVLNNGGEIDKFIGDGILAFFQLRNKDEVTKNEESLKKAKQETVHAAIRACLRMFDQLKKFNLEMKDRFNFTFDIRIGLHAGNVIYGDIGHSEYKSQTVLGDTVNVASRLEALNKKTNTSFLVSDEIYKIIGKSLSVNKKVITRLRGKSEKMTAYSVLGFKVSDPVLRIQKSFDHVLENNPRWIEDYVDKLKSFVEENLDKNLEENQSLTNSNEFLNVIESIIEKLGNPVSLKKEVSKLAKIYESFGISKKEFPKLVPILISSIRENLPSEWNAELESIWNQMTMDLTIETIES